MYNGLFGNQFLYATTIKFQTSDTNNVSATTFKTICSMNIKGLEVNGITNIHNGSPYAVANNYMASGSLTIGGTNADYGNSSGWTTNTAGLMMECADYTEICVHDSGTRLASLLYYNGPAGQVWIGKDKGWGAMATVCNTFYCSMLTIDTLNTDHVVISGNTASMQYGTYQLKVGLNTFTGIHRVFTEDILFNKGDPQKFKDDYIGRIVISTGKTATDLTDVKEEWNIKYDKDGITIEDALPMIELSRKKKDKRVFGVMGSPSRSNSRAERLIVNSVGEGGIWICNSNGNIENGDYIQSSDHLGYGEKQDDDLLHNYTVAKATMDCNFELDSPLYNCIELQEEGIRIAFISCSYHCG